jgi:hypothetical protein
MKREQLGLKPISLLALDGMIFLGNLFTLLTEVSSVDQVWQGTKAAC